MMMRLKGLHAVSEWIEANPLKQAERLQRSVSSQWEPPPDDFIKCNFDCSFSQESNVMKVGWIVRDSQGSFLEAGWATLPQVSSPLQAEAMAFIYVVQRMWVLGRRKVWFEGDNLVLTTTINQGKQNVELGNLLWDIRHWISKLPLSSLGYVNREKNQAADALAKHNLHNCLNIYKVYVSPPIWLVNFLYSPFTV
ncbi:unnamed protein product [Microthlaspi erraticum]|uniref:RNase H type-1 domain-containing protein n=1 Tax=Microthlaspi erraticum TaxID=1685480 RepID=A0A6D2K698_9BRAS|nr:unnamed protein product [Microthlaspi erraticum]